MYALHAQVQLALAQSAAAAPSVFTSSSRVPQTTTRPSHVSNNTQHEQQLQACCKGKNSKSALYICICRVLLCVSTILCMSMSKPHVAVKPPTGQLPRPALSSGLQTVKTATLHKQHGLFMISHVQLHSTTHRRHDQCTPLLQPPHQP